MEVKIFGGAGFIGNHLVKKLLACGHGVTVFDWKKPRITGAGVSDPTGSSPSWYNAVKFIGGDVCNYKQVYYAIDKGDFVVNLAAVSQFAAAENAPHVAAAINVAGAANVMQACIENKASQLVHISTGSVYSTECRVPIDEGQPLAPNSVYGLTKLWGENLLRYRADRLSLTILRLPHVIGPGKTWGANTFIVKILANERPVIFGDGSTQNDFTYVDDVVQAIQRSLEKQVTGVFNIGTGMPRTTLDFLNICRRCLDRMDVQPLYAPPRGVDFPVFAYDISKARRELGYSPQYALEDAISKTCLEWQQWL